MSTPKRTSSVFPIGLTIMFLTIAGIALAKDSAISILIVGLAAALGIWASRTARRGGKHLHWLIAMVGLWVCLGTNALLWGDLWYEAAFYGGLATGLIAVFTLLQAKPGWIRNRH